jgi:hypothetical protein
VTKEQERRARRIAEKQFAMNQQTIAALERAGLRADDEVELDFMFVAPDEASAESLKSYLAVNDCESVDVKAVPDKPEFFVSGKSLPTVVTAAVLDRWVQWMAVQGVLRNCEFDGWGTTVPRTKP